MNKNIIGKVNAKHGIFHFCHFDEFIGKSFREYGEYSELELKTILEFINEGDVIFDIGANIGCFSVPFAKKVGSNGKVYAFEPQKFIFNLLKKNAVCNELNNLQIFNNAIGDANTILELNDFDYSQSGNFGGITLTENYDNSVCAKIKGTKKNKIKTLTLNNFLNLKKCNFLKIDVELMESNVLKGAKEFIKKFRPIIWVENHLGYPNYLNKYLLKINYKPFWAATMMYNPDNHFISDKNYYENILTYNTLAMPKEKAFLTTKSAWLNEIFDEYTKAQRALTKFE
tara:strand:+ start:112 stop:966 length:855 start_codon:yes stop_codon:yes gene_type:complete